MTNALTERNTGIVITPEQVTLIKRTVAKDATDDELKLYFYDCQRRGVHPLDKLIHFTKRGGRYTPITSIDFMRTRAAESGEMAGSDDAMYAVDEGLRPIAATVSVYRMTEGQRFAYTATARWSEYCPAAGQNHMWLKMPHTMLAKCAEALALRKAFPQQLAGLYAREEMEQAGPDIATVIVQATEEERAARPPAPEGTVYVEAVVPAGNGKLWHVTFSTGEVVQCWKQATSAVAENAAQFMTPVIPKIKNGKLEGITKYEPPKTVDAPVVPEPVKVQPPDVDEIPF